MFKIRRYTKGDEEAWNKFVAESKNGTFLLDRRYMDYHSDRFSDFSLLVFDERDDLTALLPANRVGDRVTSHGGLTYGGIVSDRSMTISRMLDLFACVRTFLAEAGVAALDYKTIPAIYHRLPAEEDRFALFIQGAELARRDVLSVIDLTTRGPVQERRLRGARKAKSAGILVERSKRWEEFWSVLSANLGDRHDRRPVHTLEEILLLHGRFPANIQLFVATKGRAVLGGTVLFLAGRTVHAQYIGSNEEGRGISALDHLFEQLIRQFEGSSDARYFDFGISNEGDGRNLNRGLVEFKEGFGARAVVHDHYSLAIND
jgi:hypothetical protein